MNLVNVVRQGVRSIAKSGSAKLTGDVTLSQGANVTLTQTGQDIAIASSGGGGGGTATTVEVDLGSTPVWQGKFTITDAAITGTSKVLCWQAPGPYTGKGTRADEAEMDPLEIIAVEPASGSAVAKWRHAQGYRPVVFGKGGAGTGNDNVAARQDLIFLTQTASAGPNVYPAVPTTDWQRTQRHLQVMGRVKGNVKFSYTVFS